jgi:hypothetical protein
MMRNKVVFPEPEGPRKHQLPRRNSEIHIPQRLKAIEAFADISDFNTHIITFSLFLDPGSVPRNP